MKNLFKVLALLMLVSVAVFAFAGCIGKANDLVGYWKNDELGYDFVYTFNADGTGNYDAAGTQMPFTYKLDGNKISFLYDGYTETLDTTFTVNGDELVIKDSNDLDTIYKKTDSGVASKVPEDENECVTIEGESEFGEDMGGYAGSNIPLKDNHDEAEYQIKVAMQNLLIEQYGEDVFDARFYVNKIYTAEDEAEVEALKEMNLGPNEVAFEVKYDIKPAEGVDPNIFTAATGMYDEETGWVTEKYNLGILRPTGAEPAYEITNFGTGW